MLELKSYSSPAPLFLNGETEAQRLAHITLGQAWFLALSPSTSISSCWWKEWAVGGCERVGIGLLHEAFYFSAPPEGSELPGPPEISIPALSLPSWKEALNARCRGGGVSTWG